MNQTQILVMLLRAIASGSDAKATQHDVIFIAAADEIERLAKISVMSPVKEPAPPRPLSPSEYDELQKQLREKYHVTGDFGIVANHAVKVIDEFRKLR
jgi:hypothetical protein